MLYLRLEEAAEFIGINLKRFGGINVFQYKEKYGTVRVYCEFGSYAFPFLNPILIPYQSWVYKKVYQRAVNLYPDLADRITKCADYKHLLKEILND